MKMSGLFCRQDYVIIKIMKKRVIVAMSGGVDSSVAAALLQKQGYEVIGITMCFNLADASGKKPSCCGITGIEDARSVAHKLGIKHYVLNLQKVFNKEVILDFCRQYLSGKTPNPCVRCNQFIKFDALLKKSLALGAAFMATGHYAKIEKTSAGYLLKKARDPKKDQSYFLYCLGQKQLKHILFPLGDYAKADIRILAKELALPVADKLDSQEICFLPDNNYRDFLSKFAQASIKPGEILGQAGNILGSHRGAAFYTIGQRRGLGISSRKPLYVTEIKDKSNQIIVGPQKEAFKKSFLVKDLHYVNRPFKKKIEIKARIRYNQKESSAGIFPVKNKIKVIFKEPQFAITPGQSAVFYSQDAVLGGGIIEKIL